MRRAFSELTVENVRGCDSLAVIDRLAIEEPLEIQLRYGPAESRATKSISVTMRTPGNDFELAAGFLFTEGLIKDPADIQTLNCASVEDRSGFTPTEKAHPNLAQKN